jgi:glycosyltransferase involved in cell wall biosynthesis
VSSAHRFAFIAPNYHPITCGVGDNTMRLAAEVRRRGHHAVVFSHTPVLPHPEAPEVPVRGVFGTDPVTVAAALAREITAQEFSHAIIEYAPQMWGASRFGSPGVPLLAASLERSGIRVALVIHELFTPWKRRPDLAMGGALLRLQLGAVMRSCDPIFVTTESRGRTIATAVTALSPPRALRTYRIGPGALPRPAKPCSDGHRVGLFSTLAVGKAFDVVVSAFEEIARTYPDAELLLLGDLGPPGNRPLLRLQDQIAASPAAGRIQLTGKLPLAEVARQVASLDLYLFPMSTGANTRSSTLPLALGAGVPTIAINGSETDPLFAHRQNIFFANDLTGPAFARAALTVFAAPELAVRLSQGGRALYERNLTWERIADSLLQAIEGDREGDHQEDQDAS